MKRILLFTGKGGVGKTSIAAATALRCAALGYRTVVISTDSAHSLSDSFDMTIGPEPTPLAHNLWGQELDVLHQMNVHWGRLQDYMSALLAWRGMEGIIAEELSVFPGMEELASLIQVVHLHDSGDYDVIVIDCAPTGATLQLLTMPEIATWYIKRILPLERKAFAMGAPLIRAITDAPLPGDQVFGAMEDLLGHLDRTRTLLQDPDESSVRLVLTPERMVIKEAQRAHTYLSLYGYAVDSVVCNRVLPPQPPDAYFAEWHAIQAQHHDTIVHAFAPLPVLDVPYYEREVVGVDMLDRVCTALYGERDPTETFYRGPQQRVRQEEDGYTLILPLPFASRDAIQLTRTSLDELVVRIGNHKHVLSLPHTLAAMQVSRARYQNNALCIRFIRESRLDAR